VESIATLSTSASSWCGTRTAVNVGAWALRRDLRRDSGDCGGGGGVQGAGRIFSRSREALWRVRLCSWPLLATVVRSADRHLHVGSGDIGKLVASSSLLLEDCVVSVPLRWQGRVACSGNSLVPAHVCLYSVVAVLLRCTEPFSGRGYVEEARSMFATTCLSACVRHSVVRAQAFTDTLAGGSGGGVFGVSFPRRGNNYRASCPEACGLTVKTWSSVGQVMMAPSASLPPWRRCLWRLARLVVAWEFGLSVCSGSGSVQGQCVGGKV
jgi:hypothetical protein